MKIAVFGRKFEKSFEAGLNSFFNLLQSKGSEIFIYEPFADYLNENFKIQTQFKNSFNSFTQITNKFDFFFSLGGDGTFLEAVRYVRDSHVPIIGINVGRLGFLANIAQEEISASIDLLFDGDFLLEERSLIKFETELNPFHEFPFGLNEVTIQKLDSSLITIEAEVNGNYLNTYWTDGLIISTPTGSTAYSMSVGGPIVSPDCNALIISPIASHNLTVRPIVITDNQSVKLKITGRSQQYVATLDSRSFKLKTGMDIELTLAEFKISFVRLANHSFYKTIRKKLMWGADIRNY